MLIILFAIIFPFINCRLTSVVTTVASTNSPMGTNGSDFFTDDELFAMYRRELESHRLVNIC